MKTMNMNMKRTSILLAFALLACLAHGATLGGLNNITIFGNDDPNSCRLTLSFTIQTKQLDIYQSFFNPNQTCTQQNLQFANVFRGDQVYGNLTFTQTAHNGLLSGALTRDDLHKFNGTACGILGDGYKNGSLLAACRFRWGNIFFHLAFLLDKTTLSFKDGYTGIFFPNFGNTNVNFSNFLNVLTPNKTFPQIVGLISQSSATNSSVITDINKNIWVTGTELVSNGVDLNALLGDFELDVMIIKPRNKPDNEFIVWKPVKEVIPFASKGTKGTIDTGIKFNEVIGDFATCVGNGCEVTFILQKGYNLFMLQTNGFTTQAPARSLRQKLRP